MVLPDSHGISRAPYYLGTHSTDHTISSTGVAPTTPGLSRPFDYDMIFSLFANSAELTEWSHNPEHATPAGYHTCYGLASSAFARHYSRNHMLFSLPAGTEMFHFPAFPPNTLYIQMRVTGHISSRVSPFGNPRITARLPTPRGLSQAPTSFIGSWCQGIHRAPLQTSHKQTTQRTKMLASTVQFSSNGQHQPHTHHPPGQDPDSLAKGQHHTRRNKPTRAYSLRTQQHAINQPPHPGNIPTTTHPQRGEHQPY